MAEFLKKLKLPALPAEKIQALSKKWFQDPNEKLMQDLKLQLQLNPQDMRLKKKIGELYYKLGQMEEAIALFGEIAAECESSEFLLKAIEAYKDILKIRPDWVDINLKMSAVYQKLNMITEAANQMRIAIHHFARRKDPESALKLAEQLVHIDPSLENRMKLAEIYQNCGMTEDAVKQYEFLARDARQRKNYDKLLHFYELILPHRPDNLAIVKDICILYLRKKQPERVMHILDRAKVLNAPDFQELVQKTKLMQEALRKQRKG